MYFNRKIEAKIKENLDNNKVIILTGMRRSGKTTLLKEIFKDLPQNKIWLDFENPLNIKIFEDIDYDDIVESLVARGLNKKQRMYVFIDEVQNFPEISKIVKYLNDHFDIKFVLTGSASFYLKNLFPESLAGRKIILELFPLDFEEYLTFKQADIELFKKLRHKKKIKEIEYEYFDKAYEEFIEWGGFPQVVLADSIAKKEEELNEIFSSYWQKEILGLSDYHKNEKIRDLILLLASRVGSRLDIVKLSQTLAITRKTVYSYLSFLEATYFIYLVSPYSKSSDREVSGSQKVYLCDNGILKILTKLNSGQLFENTVFNQLKQKGALNYYQKRTGPEIDFILDKKSAFEVKVKATKSDVKSLLRTAEVLKLERVLIISQKLAETNNIIYGQFL